MRGKLKWFNKDKGFGFIAGDDGLDYFLHNSQLPEDETLVPEEELEFEVNQTDRGPQAIDVKKVLGEQE